MLNRRHIRIKVMQTIYAFGGHESDDLKPIEKFLNASLKEMYNLFLLQLSLLIEIQKKAEDFHAKVQKKHLATTEEKNPSTKFIDNQILQLLKENERLNDEIEQRQMTNWNVDFDYVDAVFKEIRESEIYQNYMKTETSSFKEDKEVVVQIFTDIIAPNEKLYDYIEDKRLTWLDDLPVINTMILKLLRKSNPERAERHFVPNLYKDADDEQFAMDLLKKTVLNESSLNQEIAARTKNWDADRIASLDSILLKMAICEFQKFPSIPVKVTMNEYVEIAKEYSTPKSSNFINGILDKVVREYKESGQLNKMGRGLM